MIYDFYSANDKKLVIKSQPKLNEFNGYCLLGPYESIVGEKDNMSVDVNSFLDGISFEANEDYWNIVLINNGQFKLVQIDQYTARLLTPKSLHMKQQSCFAGSEIVLTKIIDIHRKIDVIKLGE